MGVKLDVIGLSKWGTIRDCGVPDNDPEIMHFNRILPYKPSILEYPHLGKPPYV